MKTKYLLQALKFACLPTLSVLVLLFVGFFSVTKPLAFISSDNGFAIALRVLLVIAELSLVYYMYKMYEEEDKKQELLKINNENKENLTKGNTGKSLYYNESVYKLGKKWTNDDNYLMYETELENMIIVERIEKIRKY